MNVRTRIAALLLSPLLVLGLTGCGGESHEECVEKVIAEFESQLADNPIAQIVADGDEFKDFVGKACDEDDSATIIARMNS